MVLPALILVIAALGAAASGPADGVHQTTLMLAGVVAVVSHESVVNPPPNPSPVSDPFLLLDLHRASVWFGLIISFILIGIAISGYVERAPAYRVRWCQGAACCTLALVFSTRFFLVYPADESLLRTFYIVVLLWAAFLVPLILLEIAGSARFRRLAAKLNAKRINSMKACIAQSRRLCA